jgi:hypothetical protein
MIETMFFNLKQSQPSNQIERTAHGYNCVTQIQQEILFGRNHFRPYTGTWSYTYDFVPLHTRI